MGQSITYVTPSADLTGGGPPPGWYDDPTAGTGLLRYWDGGAWTETTRPRPATTLSLQATGSVPQTSLTERPVVRAGLAAAIGLLLLLGSITADTDESETTDALAGATTTTLPGGVPTGGLPGTTATTVPARVFTQAELDALVLTQAELPPGLVVQTDDGGTTSEGGGPDLVPDPCMAAWPAVNEPEVEASGSFETAISEAYEDLMQFATPALAQAAADAWIAGMTACPYPNGTAGGLTLTSRATPLTPTGVGEFVAALRVTTTISGPGGTGSFVDDYQLVRVGRLLAVIDVVSDLPPAPFPDLVARAVDKARPAA